MTKKELRDQTILSKEILDAIENGDDISCINVKIEDELNLNNLKSVHIDKKQIYTHLSQIYYYLNCTDGARIINSSIEFKNCVFLNKVNFSCCIFKKDVTFWKCDIQDDAIFEAAIFCSVAQFNRVRFLKYSSFSASKFCKSGEFFLASFNLGPDFSKAYFKSSAYFERTIFSDRANFGGSSFDGELSLKDTTIKKIELDSIFGEESVIILDGSDFSRLSGEWKLIKGHLATEKSTFKSIYLYLIRNYELLGRFDDADACYLQYRDKRRDYDVNRPLNKFIDWIPLLIYGYGTKPLYPLFWIVLTIFLSFISYMIIYYDLNDLQALCPLQIGSALMDALYFGLTSILANPQADNHSLKWIAIISRASGTLLIPIFLVTMARKILR
jgi:hypothetical protein